MLNPFLANGKITICWCPDCRGNRRAKMWSHGSVSTQLSPMKQHIVCQETFPPQRKKLSQSTWNLIRSRQFFNKRGIHEEVKAPDRKIKKEARADRKRQVINQFQSDPQDPYRKKVWKAVNHLRRDYKPSYVSNYSKCPWTTCTFKTTSRNHCHLSRKRALEQRSWPVPAEL